MNNFSDKKTIKALIIVTIILLVIFSPFLINSVEAEQGIQFTNIQVAEIGGKRAEIKWSTNQHTYGKVIFGKAEDSMNDYIIDNSGFNLHHQVILGNLEPKIDYYYQIIASNVEEKEYSFVQSFTTEDYHDTIPPDVDNLDVPYTSGNAAVITWETDEPGTSVVEFDRYNTYSHVAANYDKVYDHMVVLRNLKPLARHYIRVYSVDKDHNKSSYFYKEFSTSSTNIDEQDLIISDFRPSSLNDENITDKAVTVSFKTNHWAHGYVKLGGTRKDFVWSRKHEVTFNNLTPNKDYSLYVGMRDIFNKIAEVENIVIKTKEAGYKPVDADSLEMDKDSNLIFYSSFNNNSEPDLTAGSKNFSILGDTMPIVGRYSKAVKISQSSQIKYESNENFHINSGTIAFWFYPSWDSDDDKSHMLFNINTDYNNRSEKYFLIGKMTRPELKINNKLSFGLEDSRDSDYWCYIDENFIANKWYFVVATWEYNNGYRLYFNGSNTNLNYINDKKLGNAPNIGQNIYLGGENKYFNSSSDFAIDELMIFNTVLSEDQIRKIYNRTYDFKSLNINNDTGILNGVGGGDSLLSNQLDFNGPSVTVKGVEHSRYSQASALYKIVDSPAVYAIVNGQRHYISSPTSFNEYGYDWGNIKIVSREELLSYPRARLIKSPDNPTIYYLYQRPENQWLKIAIPSPTAFVSYPENHWGNVITVTQLDVDSYPDVELIKTKNDAAVYYLEDNIKHFIPEDVFKKYDFSVPEIVEVSQVHLNTYKTGEPLE